MPATIPDTPETKARRAATAAKVRRFISTHEPAPPPDTSKGWQLREAAARVSPEQRRAWSAKGGRTNSDPDHLIRRLTRVLPSLTAAQRHRLIALAQAAEDAEAQP